MVKSTELKTKVNDASVTEFINTVEDEGKRTDCFKVLEMMSEITGEPAKMWGNSIVGFGSYHYKGASGREGDWMLTAFSPRKQNLTIYIMGGFDRHALLLEKLGKFTISGGSCLYVKKLADVDKDVLKELIEASVKVMKNL